MQATGRHAGSCILCVFRCHIPQLARQQSIRHRSTTSTSRAATSQRRRDSSSDVHLGQILRRVVGTGGKGRQTGARNPQPFNHRLRPQFRRKVDFADVLAHRLDIVKQELKHAPILQHLGDDPSEAFKPLWRTFLLSLDPDASAKSTSYTAIVTNQYQMLRDAFYDRGINSLDDRLKYAFYDHVTGSRFTESDIQNQKAMADLRYPIEWFPATRSLHRVIHLHVGPTNSGKTYHALQRLEQANSGIYAGPLRLLAHEVYTRMNAKGKRCILVTGEERRAPDDSTEPFLTSCTVEMAPLNAALDVAVIDEIQMIGNPERGWAWTQALMGVKAKEVHLCGEERTVPLIRQICASVGDKLVVHKYNRLSPLQMADKGLDGDLSKLRKGDCIVSFSVMGIHALRKEIEENTGRKVATVYGSLPPETRAQQARLFNDPDNDYDFLIASDAIGMGLNLSIKRIIFESSNKFDGFRQKTLSIADIKQIGGRAGRYRSAHQQNESAQASQQSLYAAKGEPTSTTPAPGPVEVNNQITPVAVPAEAQESTMGLVTTLERYDFPIIAAAMRSEPEPIRTAGLFPPAAIVERFASYFPPGTPFSYILVRLHELSQMHPRFHLCGLRDQLWIADLIEPVQGLSVADRHTMCACPASKSDKDMFKHLLPALGRCIAEQSGGSILDIPELPLETLEEEVSPNRDHLRRLESLHKGIVAYLWLSFRFAGIFSTRSLAQHVKSLVEDRIEQVLGSFSFTEAQRRAIAARKQSIAESLHEDVGRDSGEPDPSTVAGGDQFGGEKNESIVDPVEDAVISGTGADDSAVVADDGLHEAAATGSFDKWAKTHTEGDDALPMVSQNSTSVSPRAEANGRP